MSATSQGTELPNIRLSNSDPTILPGVSGIPNQLLIRTDTNELYFYRGPLDTNWSKIGSGGGGVSGLVLPSSLLADVNDFSIPGSDVATTFILTPVGAARSITGLAGGVLGRIVWIVNPTGTGQNLSIVGESALSAAANRFRPADGNNGSSPDVLRPCSAEAFVYNGTRWQGLAKTSGTNIVADNNITSNGSLTVAGNIACGTINVTTTASLSVLSLFGTSTLVLANQNDWVPGSFNISTRVDAVPDANRVITGLAQGFANRVVIIQNISAFTLTLNHEDAMSAAANRFQLPGAVNYVIPAERSIMLYHTGVRWRALLQ